MPKTAAFDRYSEAYDEWFAKNADLYEAELEAVRRLLPAHRSEGVEVGVGSGQFAAPLGIKIGIEPSTTMADKARRRGIAAIPGVAEALPFGNSRFGFILMVTTICFVDDILTSFKEAHRVLKQGGAIVIGLVDRDSELGKRYDRNKEQSRFYQQATFFSAREVLTCLKRAGFVIIAIRQTLIPGESPQTIQEGFGSGAFVVIKGAKSIVPKEAKVDQCKR